MSYGFYRMGANVSGKVLPTISFAPNITFETLTGPAIAPKPAPPALADTLVNQQPAIGRKEAKQQGYTGDACTSCGSMQVKISGHCTVCEACGNTSGCS